MEHNAMYELYSSDFYDNLRDVRLHSFEVTDIGDSPVNNENVQKLEEILNNLCDSAKKMCSLKEEALSALRVIKNGV